MDLINNSDTEPSIINPNSNKILSLELEINNFISHNIRNGKCSYLLMAEKEIMEILKQKYISYGWIIKIGYSGENVFCLDFKKG